LNYLYRGFSKNFQLHEDDLKAIARLYGQRDYTNKPVSNENTTAANAVKFSILDTEAHETHSTLASSTQAPTSKPELFSPDMFLETASADLCHDGKFDAISVLSDNFTYIFKNNLVYRLGKNIIFDINQPLFI